MPLGFSANEARVLAALLTGEVEQQGATLAERLGRSRSSVSQALVSLQAAGLVVCKSRPGQRRLVYRVSADAVRALKEKRARQLERAATEIGRYGHVKAQTVAEALALWSAYLCEPPKV